MILIINTTDRNKIDLGLYDNSQIEMFNFDTVSQSDDLLVAIDGILKNKKITLNNIKTILVNQGPGSYTGVRLGITLANTLAWSLNIPVVGFRDGDINKTIEKVVNLKKNKFSTISLPYYD